MLDNLKIKSNWRRFVSIIPTVVFLCFIFYMSARTFTGTVKKTFTETQFSGESVVSLTNDLENVLRENFYMHNWFINLNGMMTRILGIHTLNERYKLANGYLISSEGIKDTTYASDNIIELNEFLEDRGIPFVYVFAPSKTSFYDVEFAPGYSSDAWQNIDSMIDVINEAGINAIDMDLWFETNGWKMEDVFYKTDHHWIPQAALEAAKCTMELLSSQGLVDYDETSLNEDSWTITIFENWFLGSHGKRTGSSYVGVDDILLYIPKFTTDYAYSYLKRNSTNWVYTDTILELSYLINKDYFNSNPYNIYMISDSPIRTTINNLATNDQRVLIMGGSYKMPYEYFLTTQFKEVYTIDLRYYTDGTLAQYIEEIQPDIVLMCTYSDTLSNKALYTFGVSDYMTALERSDEEIVVFDLGNFTMQADEMSQDVFRVISSNLEPNQTYTLTVDSTDYSGGKDQYIQMTLQDLSENKAIFNRYFDANNKDTQKWIFNVPEGSDTYAIYLYAGTKGHTAGVSVDVTGIKLWTNVIED